MCDGRMMEKKKIEGKKVGSNTKRNSKDFFSHFSHLQQQFKLIKQSKKFAIDGN
jgi:hypothetical protein